MSPSAPDASTSVAAHELPLFRESLLKWVAWCGREGPRAADVDAWRAALAEDAVYWRLAGQWTADRIHQRGSAVACVAGRLDGLAITSADGASSVADWLQCAGELCSGGRDGRGSACARSVGEWTPQNPLVRTIFAQSLVDGLDKSRLPRAKASVLLPLLAHEQRPAQSWPLLPAAGFPVEPDAYLYPCQGRQEMADQWQRLKAGTLEATQLLRDALLRQGTTARGAVPESTFVDKARHAADQLTALVHLARVGWPVAAATVAAQWKQWSDALGEVGASRLAATTRAAERCRGIVEQSRQWFEQWRVSASPATVFPPDKPAALAPASAEWTAPPGAPTPVSVEPARSPDPDVTTRRPPMDDSASPIAAALARQANDVREVAPGHAFSQSFAGRLRELAENWRVSETDSPASGGRSAPSKGDQELLACLTTLDDLPVAQRRGLAWWTSARAVLRRLVAERAVYRILDEQLAGKRLAGHENLVEVVGLEIDASVPAGHISRVVRPGYAYSTTAGDSVVLRRAQVEVAAG